MNVAASVTFGDSLPELRLQMRQLSWWVVLLATWVIVSLAQGVAGIVILGRPANETFVLALIYGVGPSVVWGAVGSWQLARQEVAAGLPGAADLPTRLAAAGDSVPDDAQVRADAAALLRRRRSTTPRQRVIGWTVLVLATALSVALALLSTPLWWTTTAVLLLVPPSQWHARAGARRRLERLEA